MFLDVLKDALMGNLQGSGEDVESINSGGNDNTSLYILFSLLVLLIVSAYLAKQNGLI